MRLRRFGLVSLASSLAALSVALKKANALGLYSDPRVATAQALFAAVSAGAYTDPVATQAQLDLNTATVMALVPGSTVGLPGGFTATNPGDDVGTDVGSGGFPLWSIPVWIGVGLLIWGAK